jgi:Adenylate and Guanylate cyclase catalytic domain
MRAALEIVHTVKRASSTEDLAVRIGIATGPVVVGEAAGVGEQSRLAVGSTPNLAARLQGAVYPLGRSITPDTPEWRGIWRTVEVTATAALMSAGPPSRT